MTSLTFWNLHRNSDGQSYNLRIGNGPLSGNILTFTEKKERNDNDENTQLEDENRGSTARDSEETNSYEDDFLNNEQEDNNFPDENNTSPSEHYDETMGNSTFE